jgi:hypothetical protein
VQRTSVWSFALLDRGLGQTAILSPHACRANIPERLDWNKSARHLSEPGREALSERPGPDDEAFMTVAIIVVGVQLFGLACGIVLSKAAATDRSVDG